MDYSLISYSCILVYLKKPGFEKTQGKNRFIWKNPGFIGFFQNFGFFANPGPQWIQINLSKFVLFRNYWPGVGLTFVTWWSQRELYRRGNIRRCGGKNRQHPLLQPTVLFRFCLSRFYFVTWMNRSGTAKAN